MKRMIAVHKHLEGTKRDEGLAGEIYEELSRLAEHIIRYQADGDRHAEHECKMVFANNIIARVLSANKEQPKKKHEELVEEIARNFCICCGELDWDSGLCERTDPPTNRLCDLIKKIVPDAINDVLSAVRDRLELPGEVGRWKWPTLEEPNEGINAWTGDMLRTGNEVFIALRPPSGTSQGDLRGGKEEEEDLTLREDHPGNIESLF